MLAEISDFMFSKLKYYLFHPAIMCKFFVLSFITIIFPFNKFHLNDAQKEKYLCFCMGYYFLSHRTNKVMTIQNITTPEEYVKFL